MKAIITRNFEARGDRETPKFNTSISLKAGTKPRTLPQWAIRQAVAAGAAEFVPKKTTKSDADGASEPDE